MGLENNSEAHRITVAIFINIHVNIFKSNLIYMNTRLYDTVFVSPISYDGLISIYC